ncbi:TPR repeat-containing thioredoxin TTL1-like [Tripterygium wilfordii]|uniref:TPR repeat-containing thioredoxin TTL1-like n=1 Tax=Tripterygium wilfordii TaxID=458696 RepID=A0A7J7D0B8_TRIWF|nr:inactive TPR repeat-containing thioredoxin TTL3-like [Tripterygium wilfordii]KAF5739728.1 TPR repeat-containing thioredoxin TTL1-like [Tripterygium wilfordii]
MAETKQYSMEHEQGCGFFGGIFQRRIIGWPKKKASIYSLPSSDSSEKPERNSFKKQRSHPHTSILYCSSPQKPHQKHTRKRSEFPPKPSIPYQKTQSIRNSDAARISSSSSSSSGRLKVSRSIETKPRKDPSRNSKELNKIVSKQTNSEGKALIRAASSNVMLLGQLGNLRQAGNGNSSLGNNSLNATIKTVDYLYRDLQEVKSQKGCSRLGGNGVMGNIVRQSRLDPEVLKLLGNEKYKQGRFEEALDLYDKAISLDPSKATYRSNRSAALIGLGRLLEAAMECKEAILLQPSYQRAHRRLAALYLRLGEAEKSLHHFELSGSDRDSEVIVQARILQKHLTNSIQARKLKDWTTLLKETQCAISSGADSAPNIYALQAEALLRLQRHEEAYSTTQEKGPKFSIDSCTKFFGPLTSGLLLTIKALVYMAAGRFEDSVRAAEEAARLDPTEVVGVLKRAKSVASARLSGNLLFKASKFSEACLVYSQGLEHDQQNSVLLCNRAACRSKLGKFEKAVEDCTAALNVWPSYIKARLRRADCNVKLERFEAAIQDYEVVLSATPANEYVGRALVEAQVQLKKQHESPLRI